jgi:hypothetical protein
MRGALAAVAFVTLAGCGDTRSHQVERDLAALRHGPTPLYYVGTSFAGLRLTAVDSQSPGGAAFIYGTCKIPPGQDGGCAPPLQIQNFPFSGRDWGAAVGCSRQPSLRHLTTVRHDGLVLFSGRRVSKIYGRSPSEERRVALALRDIRSDRPPPAALPPTPAAVRQLVATVCR